MTTPVYILSGLGADERVFQYMDFLDFNIVFIKWLDPQKDESIQAYATRIISQITDPRPILIGISFGGMMATEIAKQIPIEKIILIASAKTKREIPIYYRLAGKLNLHRLIPASLLKKANFITYWLFGIKSFTHKEILKSILNDTNIGFLSWAIDKIVKWDNKILVANIFHIHGTTDRVLPIKFVNFNVKILGGGHLMTLDKSAELSCLIRQQIFGNN